MENKELRGRSLQKILLKLKIHWCGNAKKIENDRQKTVHLFHHCNNNSRSSNSGSASNN
jgi:hypothetical protein